MTPGGAEALSARGREGRTWAIAAASAIAAHLAAALAVLAWSRPAEPPAPEPVVLVELPAAAGPVAETPSAPAVAQPAPTPVAPVAAQLHVPAVSAPLPEEPVVLPAAPLLTPARPPAPVAAVPALTPTPVVPQAGSGGQSSRASGSDPRAKAAELDYFALISAHLNRRKIYPPEARKARQEGVVTIRFTVDRAGNVSAAAIKRGSGHDLLDQATLELLQRVAPLPRMPATMARESVTLALPIEYSLKKD